MIPLQTEELRLYDLMSSISDVCYKAGWINGLEYSIWDALDSTNFKFGNNIMDPEVLKEIKTISKELNGWVVWIDDENDPTLPPEEWGPKFIPMDVWLEMVNKYNSFSITI